MKKHSFIFVIFTLIFTIISCQPTTTVIVIDSSASQDTSESVNEISLSDGNWQYTQNVTLAEQEVTNRKYKYTSTRVTVLNFTVKSGEIKSIQSGSVNQAGLITGNIENAKADFKTTDRITGSSTAVNNNGYFTSSLEVPESGNALYIMLLNSYLPSSSTSSTTSTSNTAAASTPSVTDTYDIKTNSNKTKYRLSYKTLPENYTSAEITFVKQQEFNSEILNLDIPILGLCYGHYIVQLGYNGSYYYKEVTTSESDLAQVYVNPSLVPNSQTTNKRNAQNTKYLVITTTTYSDGSTYKSYQ